jgi:hypothetical protein
MTTLLPPTLPVLHRQGVDQAPMLEYARSMANGPSQPSNPDDSKALAVAKDPSAIHSPLVISVQNNDNNSHMRASAANFPYPGSQCLPTAQRFSSTRLFASAARRKNS